MKTNEINYLLCRWLQALHQAKTENKADDRHVKQRYIEYYKWLVGNFDQTPPSRGLLLRFIENLVRRDTRIHEDPAILAQDLISNLMIKNWNHVVQDRPAAACQVGRYHSQFPQVEMDLKIQPDAESWADDLKDWADWAMDFGRSGCQSQEDCQKQAEDINEQWNRLSDAGKQLLKIIASYEQSFEEDELNIADEFDTDTADSDDCVQLLGSLLKASSKVRVPIHTILYWQARKMVLDYADSAYTKYESSENKQEDDTEETFHSNQKAPLFHTDPNAIFEAALTYEYLVSLLKTSVRDCEAVVKTAKTDAEIAKAKTKLDKCLNRFHIHELVLFLMTEGYNQDEIAKYLGKTRDQIKDIKRDMMVEFAKGLSIIDSSIKDVKKINIKQIKGEIQTILSSFESN